MESPEREPLLAGLREVGLNRYEAAVYLGLVTDQNAKVSEISKRTGVPQPKVYQALDGLVDKGFCTLGPEARNKYRPLSPRQAIEGYVGRLRGQEKAAVTLSGDLENLYQAGQGHDLWAPPIEIVKGLGHIQRFLVEQVGAAREEILFFGKGPHVPARDATQAIFDAGQRGVRLRMVYESAFLRSPKDREEIDLYRAVGGEKRETSALPSKLLVVDGSLSVTSIQHQKDGSFLALILRAPELVGNQVASFEYHFERARALSSIAV
jgi:sugar-specific transcriptional regulator TrmB